jgi:hypothetical protein
MEENMEIMYIVVEINTNNIFLKVKLTEEELNNPNLRIIQIQSSEDIPFYSIEIKGYINGHFNQFYLNK